MTMASAMTAEPVLFQGSYDQYMPTYTTCDAAKAAACAMSHEGLSAMAMDAHLAYFDNTPAAVQPLLLQVQAAVEAAVPGAERCIAYRLPAYRRGEVFFYFAAFNQHLGSHPAVTADLALVAELQPWRGPKGNIRFPLTEPLPLALIARVAAALAAQYAR